MSDLTIEQLKNAVLAKCPNAKEERTPLGMDCESCQIVTVHGKASGSYFGHSVVYEAWKNAYDGLPADEIPVAKG